MKLFPTQCDARDINAHALLRHNLAIDRSGMGVGKTYHAIATARALRKQPFFVTPLAVHADAKDALKATGTPGIVVNYEHLRTAGCPFVRSRGKDDFEWRLPPNALLVYDEAQALCNNTINGRIALAAHRQGIPILAMSATLAHTPLDFYTLGIMMGLHKGADFNNWALRQGAHMETVSINGKTETTLKFDPFSWKGRESLKRLGRLIDGDWGCRITQEMFGGFPKVEVCPRMIDAGRAAELINRAYAELEAPMTEIQKLLELADKVTPAVKRLRLRQEIEMSKVPFLADLVRESVARGESAAVFLSFTESIHQLKLLLADLRPGEISGDVSEKNRIAAKRAFQADEIRVILVQIQAGGPGISLHDITGRHPRRGFLLPADSLRSVVQASGRLGRATSLTDAVYEVVFILGTVEEDICNTLSARAKGLSLFNDGSELGVLDDISTMQRQARMKLAA